MPLNIVALQEKKIKNYLFYKKYKITIEQKMLELKI